MEIAFTAANEFVLVVNLDALPRKGDTVKIDDVVYEVDSIEWHFSVGRSTTGDFPVAEHDDTIVRLNKTGEV